MRLTSCHLSCLEGFALGLLCMLTGCPAPAAGDADADAGGQRLCAPRSEQDCSCDGGPAGVQQCDDNGAGWGSCQCSALGDGGGDGPGQDAAAFDRAGRDTGAADAEARDAAAEDREVDLALTWVSIPGGSFVMGCSEFDTGCEAAEGPRREVTVAAFELMATEITQGDYLAVTGRNPSHFGVCGHDCPVEQIDWSHASDFCAAVGGRLPSEAEWEYAARAGTTTRFSCGDEEGCLDAVAWYALNSDNKTQPVGLKRPNAFGLYDTHGNVWEWVADCWHENYDGAPATGEVWSGGDCEIRRMRGGSWVIGATHLRVSYRGGEATGREYPNVGARCARD